MIPAFCINLDRRTDRWEHMSSQFILYNMTVDRVSATDAQAADVKAELQSLPAAARLSFGALACFESHRRVWQMLTDSGASHALVLEDDLVIAPVLASYQGNSWIPAEVDLIKIETHGTRIHLSRQPLCAIGPGRTLVQLQSYGSATGGYIISARLAERLLPISRNSLDPVDDFLFDRLGRKDYAIHQMVPAPVVQGASGLARDQSGKWSETSLTEHWAAGVADVSDRAETPLGRIARRLREELRASRLGTRYATVPWG